MTGLVFHHLGLAVKTPDKAVAFLKAQGYAVGDAIFDPACRTSISVCAPIATMPNVELIWPATGKSPIDGMLQQHQEWACLPYVLHRA